MARRAPHPGFGDPARPLRARVREGAGPDPQDRDELHDALLVMGAAPVHKEWAPLYDDLRSAGRAATLDGRLWVAAERVPMLAAAFPTGALEPAVAVPERDRAKTWTREDALPELVAGRLQVIGPTTAVEIGTVLGIPTGDIDIAL